VASSNPAAATSSSCALLGQLGEQVNNVEVVEQTVHQRDDRVQDASFTKYLGHDRLHSATVAVR